MMTFIPPRLRKPRHVRTGRGVVHGRVAGARRLGHLWWVSIMAMIAAAVCAVRLYWLGGTDTDEGARGFIENLPCYTECRSSTTCGGTGTCQCGCGVPGTSCPPASRTSAEPWRESRTRHRRPCGRL
jgi:hypothetical protein